MDFVLEKPDHLAQETWDAIQSYRLRFEGAARAGDAPAVLGGAKELVESVARAVLESRGITLGANADMPKLLNEAQGALARQAGRDLSGSPEIRAIASSALIIATKVNELRNQHGTGHGRSRLPEIREEVVQVVGDAAMLWCRWALRRLGQMLARDVENLIASLRTAINRVVLQRQFDAVLMPEQSPEDQHRLGVAFGQRAAGGFGNAFVVGVAGAVEFGDLDSWPTEYRLGLVEGILLDELGRISLNEYFVDDLIGVLRPIPRRSAKALLDRLTEQVPDAPWVVRGGFRRTMSPAEVVASLREKIGDIDASVRPNLTALVDALERSAPTS